MEYIYQKKNINFLSKESLKECFIFEENFEETEEILEFTFKNLKKLLEKSKKDLLNEEKKSKNEKIYTEYFKKLEENKIDFPKEKINKKLKRSYQLIREKITQLIYSDNINFLMSNGCSIYCGSKGINNNTEKDLTSILEKISFENNKDLEKTIKGYAHSYLTPEKILDKLYQINNFYKNIILDNEISLRISKLIEKYQTTLLKNYVLGINYENLYLHEELLLKLLAIKRYNQVNIFTLNYDILIETAAESLNIPLNNGFQGFQIRKFNPANFNYKNYIETTDGNKKIEKNINLVKLHGSLSWEYDEKVVPYKIVEKQLKLNKGALQYKNIFRQNREVIIYPTQTKKSYSLDLPYSEMFRQFNEAINKSNSTLFIMGYSFLDEHINDIILSSLANPYINIVIFMYSNKEECLKNEYLNTMIKRAYFDNRITIFLGEFLGDFKNIVQDILPIEAEKDPHRELEKILSNLKLENSGDK